MANQKRSKKRERKNVLHAICHIKATFNNTTIAFTDQQGNAVAWSSGGNAGFKGSRKSTPFAAQLAAEQAAKAAIEHGVRKVDVVCQGLEVLSIRDVTPVPHNGCRPPKTRRR